MKISALESLALVLKQFKSAYAGPSFQLNYFIEDSPMVCPPDEVPLWAFGLVVVPIATLIGIATTTIGFTAWTIIVPLFFAGFKKKNFSLFETIFMSVLLDCINSALATIVFAKQSKVDWPVGLIFACIAILGSLFGLVFSNEFLLKYQEMFKRGLGFVSLVIGISFFFKGYMTWRRSKVLLTANLPVIQSSPDLEEPQRVSSSKSVVQTESSHLLNTDGGLTVPSSVVVVSTNSAPAQYQLEGSAVRTISEADKTKLSSELMENARQRRRKKLRMLAAVALALVAGVASGLIGFGGGMIFVLLFMGILQKEQLMATGTGCFVMCTLTAWLALIYETGGHWLGFAEEIHFLCIWEELLMMLLGGAVGTIIGSFFILRISPYKLNLLVGAVLFVTGLVATLQARVFPVDDEDSI